AIGTDDDPFHAFLPTRSSAVLASKPQRREAPACIALPRRRNILFTRKSQTGYGRHGAIAATCWTFDLATSCLHGAPPSRRRLAGPRTPRPCFRPRAVGSLPGARESAPARRRARWR